jgi:GNAT superfamily N-acetyltransferase
VTDVRAATPADADAVARLLHDFNVEFDDPSPGPEAIAARLATMVEREDFVALIAGDPPAGLALLHFRPVVWEEGPVALLDELYVRPDVRGQGIGGALLEGAFALARERGSQWFELDTGEDDVDARRFYERHGLRNALGDGAARELYYSRRL